MHIARPTTQLSDIALRWISEHAIEHALSALFNVPHGAGLSVVMPAWMKWYFTRNPSQFERFGKYVFGVSSAEQAIAALEAWFDKLDTPTRLAQLRIKESDLPATMEVALANIQKFGMADLYRTPTRRAA